MTNQSEFHFGVQHLRGETLAAKNHMTRRLASFAITCFSLFAIYVLMSVIIPGWMSSSDAGVNTMVLALTSYLTIGTLFVVASLKIFSTRQSARWVLK